MNLSPRDNFYRCMTLIVDNGNEAAWDLLDYYLSNQGTTLKDFIENNQHEIYHLCYNYGVCCRCKYGTVNKPKSRILYQSQLDILLDTKGSNMPCTVHVRSKPTCSHTINDHYANPNTATKQLDLTLCRCLLINFTNILPQGSVERNAFEDLINMRNKCCHAAKGEISSKDYLTYKAQIEKCLLALAQVYGKTHDMQLKIKDAEKRPLDESICKQLQQTILQEQVLQGTTIEIQKMGKSTKRTLRAVNSSMKTAGHTASKIKKIEESTKRTLMVVKSSKRSVERKLKANTERTMHAIDSSREAEGRTATKIQKIDERLSKCETSKRSRLIGLTQTEIDVHLKKGTFVETPAVHACIKLLETNSLLILTGAAGTGKSRNSLEILHQFRIKHPEYQLVKMTNLQDFTDCMLDEEKLVVLFEDIFGRTNTRFSENTDIQIIERLHACTIKGNIKVILTVRDTIKMSCEWVLKLHPFFHSKVEVDLSSEKFKMTETEKESLLLKYFFAHNFRLLDCNDPENYNEESILDPQITVTVNRETLRNIVESEPLLGFPEACCLFTGIRKFTRLGLSFFKHPLKFLYEEIEKLRKNGKDNQHDKMSYVTLIYILLNEGVLDQNNIELNICIDIFESCYECSNKKIPACHIIDSANEMIGKYLIFHSDDSTYQLQHQTIFESLLISYSRINPELILSRLSFEFIREMVRLKNYTLREGEVVMKITQTHYPVLADRIIEIIHSEDFKKSLSLNFQLLCESEIIKTNDEYFMTNLIEKAHNACMKPEYSIQRSVTCSGNLRLFNLYLPVVFLEHISQLNNMNKSIILLLDHITSILDSETEENIVFACKSSLIEACSHVCELKNNENMHIKRKTNETLIKLILEKVNHNLLDLKKIMDKACCGGGLDLVPCLLENTDLKKLDIMEAVNAVYSLIEEDYKNIPSHLNYGYHFEREKYEPLIKLIIEKVNHELLDLKKIFHKGIRYWYLDVVTFLLEKNDHKRLDIMEAVNAIFILIEDEYVDFLHYQKEKYEPLIRVILEKVNHDLLDLKKIFHMACCSSYIDVCTLILEKSDNEKLDIMEQVNTVYSSMDSIDLFFDWEHTDFQREQHEPVIKLIVEKVNHDLLNLKTVFNKACYWEYLDVVIFLIENTDLTKLDIMEAVNILNEPRSFEYDGIHEREKYKRLIKLILEKVDHDLLDFKEIMYKACRYGISEVVTFVLENIDHNTFDIMKAVKIVYKSMTCDWFNRNQIHERYEHLINLILEKVNHDLLDFKMIINKACENECLDVVAFLIEHIDHTKIDIVEINSRMIKPGWSIRPEHTKYQHFFKLILKRVNNDLLDLKRILYQACVYKLFDVIKYVIENTDIEKIDIMTIVNEVFNRKEYEPVVRLVLDKLKNYQLDLREVFNKAYRFGCVDLVSFMIENIDHEKIDIKEAVKQAYNESMDKNITCGCSIRYNEEVINLLLQKGKIDLFDMEVLMNEACRKGYVNIVRWLVENIAHSKFDIDTAINVSERSLFNNGYEDIFIILLENISQNLFDIGLVIKKVSRENYTEQVLWLLKTMDNSLFDMKYVMNEACRNSNLQITKYVLENIENNRFDVMSAINSACCSKRNSLEVVKLLFKDSRHNMYDLESAMNNACRYENVDVVKWFWTTFNRKLFNVKTAWNNACNTCNKALISYLLKNMDEKLLDKSKAMLQACRNINEGREIISFLFKTQNMNTPDNCKKVLTEASAHGNKNVVEWLLAHIDFDPLQFKESLIDSIKATMHIKMKDSSDWHNKLLCFWELLSVKSVKEFGLKDISEVMEVICSKGDLFMLKMLWENTEHRMCDMRTIVNIACESRQFEIVDWLLQNIELRDIDAKSVMVKSCGCGWFKIVKLLLSDLNITNSVIKKSIDEACLYGRYEIVKFLLENVDLKLLDKKLILEKASGYGWKDIILQLFDNKDNIYIDPKACMIEACAQGRLKIVELFISKYDINNFDIYTLIGIVCKNSDNADVTKFLIQNFELKKSHVDVIIKNACIHSWTEIVKLFLDVCKHYKTLMEEAMTNACDSGVTEMVKLLLDHVNVSFLGVQTAMIISCQKGWEEIVSLLLEQVDYSLFDFTVSMNEACRCGVANIVKLLIQKVNRKHFNFDTAIVEACKSNSYENLVLVLINYIDQKTSNTEAIYKKARGYEWRRVISRLKRMSFNEN